MNIVVLVKQVPDSGSERRLDPSDNTVERFASENVINEVDEYAIEEALTVKETHGGEVTSLTVGPATATSRVVDFAGRLPKGEGVKVPDDGAGAEQLVSYLAAQKTA